MPVYPGAPTSPSDHLSAARHFPGSPVIGGHASRAASPGAEEVLPSPHNNLLTVLLPIRRGVRRHPLQDLWCRPWPSPSKCRLGSPLVRFRGFHLRRRRLRFMLRTGQLPPPLRGVVAPLRRRDLARRREPRYRGPWRLPGPDSHRLAVLSLSLGYTAEPPFVPCARAAGRTL